MIAIVLGIATAVAGASQGLASTGPTRLERLVEAHIAGVHAFQIRLAQQAGDDLPCYSPGSLDDADLARLEAHQTALLRADVAAVKAWIEGAPSDFDPARDLEPLLAAPLVLSDRLPVNVFSAWLRERSPAPRPHVRAIANLFQNNLEVERDGGRLQELFAFYIGLGVPVYLGQLGLPGGDADFLAMGDELEGRSCPSPVGTSAAEWQIAGRKNWNWGEKNLGIRDDEVLAGELLEEPGVRALVARIRALTPRRIAVIGHSFTMDLHWASPSSFVPIVTAVFARENRAVVFRQFQAGGLTSSRARRRFYAEARAWKPDKVLLVVMNRTPEDLAAFAEMGRDFAEGGAQVLVFDDLRDPEASDPALPGREREVAEESGMTVIEVGARLAASPDAERFVCLDGIHMTEPYHMLMAREWLAFLVGARDPKLPPADPPEV